MEGDDNAGLVALRTAEEKGSVMHHPHRKAVMSTLSRYLFKIYCYSNFR
jgi:hypothetical protein